jgi:hypothetical protein
MLHISAVKRKTMNFLSEFEWNRCRENHSLPENLISSHTMPEGIMTDNSA